jgi:hypothetical protein
MKSERDGVELTHGFVLSGFTLPESGNQTRSHLQESQTPLNDRNIRVIRGGLGTGHRMSARIFWLFGDF